MWFKFVVFQSLQKNPDMLANAILLVFQFQCVYTELNHIDPTFALLDTRVEPTKPGKQEFHGGFLDRQLEINGFLPIHSCASCYGHLSLTILRFKVPQAPWQLDECVLLAPLPLETVMAKTIHCAHVTWPSKLRIDGMQLGRVLIGSEIAMCTCSL